MLSKIKASSAMTTETRSAAIVGSLAAAAGSASSDNEDEPNQINQMTSDLVVNDTNNNNQNNNMNNNQQQPSKKSEDELLDIVEVSRKRRLSKDSADSLDSFIRWSFGHVTEASNHHHNHHHRAITNSLLPKFGSKTTDELDEEIMLNEEDELEEEDDGTNEEDWSTGLANRQQQYLNNNNNNNSHNHNHNQSPRSQQQLSAEQLLLRRHAKFTQVGSSSAANLAALIKGEHRLALTSAQLLAAESADRANKRARTQQVYSPEGKFLLASQSGGASGGGAQRKSSSHLGNVVERLHQQQQRQQQSQQENQQLENEQELGSNAGLSFHLQQFLQQQTSLEDLCSSVGLDDSNQLVLAAAIHRALVDSVGPGGGGAGGGGGGGGSSNQLVGADAKSVTSSTGSSHSGASSSNNNSTSNSSSNGGSSANLGHALASTGSSANLHLVDSLVGHRQQNRAYNTRAALHGLSASNGSRQPVSLAANAAALSSGGGGSAGAMNMSNRAQQQRHAQAAAALSALAASASSNHHQHQLSTSGTPIVDFECDTCGSSFDDRHRLMQHQSIHLELKKDWFTETPVDEVMKIFNRRRGEFLCNTCNLRFEATFDYDKHNHSVHGQRPYCCQFCGNGTRTFRFWRQYLNHLYDHRYIFSCTIDDCDFTVNRRDSLRFHIFRFHLNCRLPQNQHQQLRADLLLGSNNNNNNNNNNNYNNNNIVSKWSALEEEDVNDNEMNVGE